jgi:hypothetical protein
VLSCWFRSDCYACCCFRSDCSLAVRVTLRQTVGQYVLVSSPVNSLTVMVLSYSGALSDERSGLPFVSHSLKSLSICTQIIYSLHVLHVLYIQYIPLGNLDI